MALDFIGFINANTPQLTTQQKIDMLDDFCEQYDYEEFIDDGTGGSIPNPQSKSDFANEQITRFIRESVHAARLTAGREAITIEELDL